MIKSPQALYLFCYHGEIKDIPKDWQATNNIYWQELLNKQTDKSELTLKVLKNLYSIAVELQKIHDKYYQGRKIIITSAWRTTVYNKAIDGAVNSQHILGLAIDFLIEGIRPLTVYKTLDRFWEGGLERQAGWTHIDGRGYKARF